jgi:hypothetical protein
VSRLQWQKIKRSKTSRFDSSGTYRCIACNGAYQLQVKVMEKRLREFRANNIPKQTIKIRSRRQRLELLKKYSPEMNPNFHGKRRDRAVRSRRLHSPHSPRGTLVRFWSKKDLPKNVRFGECRWCDKYIISDSKTPDSKAPLFHGPCRKMWLRTAEGRRFTALTMRGLPVSLPVGPGRPKTEQSLKTAYSWVIQYYLGHFIEVDSADGSNRKKRLCKRKSYREIAEENHVDFSTVREKTKDFVEKLPDPSLAPKRFRRVIELLTNVSKG